MYAVVAYNVAKDANKMTFEKVMTRVVEKVREYDLTVSKSTIEQTAANIFYEKQLNDFERKIFYHSFEFIKRGFYSAPVGFHRVGIERSYIYTLQDGESGLTIYVGSTDNPNKRHAYYRSSSWISKPLNFWRDNLKRFICMDLIDRVPTKDALDVEQDYIDYFKAVGCKLLNSRPAKKRCK